jgi:hypothetical protein
VTRLRKAILLSAAATLLGGAVGLEQRADAFDLGFGFFKRRQAAREQATADDQGRETAKTKAAQLVETLRNDPDVAKRKAAAAELRDLDPRTNPEVVPGLTASLLRDPSPAVRIEAVEALGKMKPVTEPAGLAMEEAAKTDPDPKVQEALGKALWQYHLNGYRTPQSGQPLATMTGGTGKGDGKSTTRPSFKFGDSFQPIKNTVGRILPPLLTPEPPLAPPLPTLPGTPPAPTVKPAPPLEPQGVPAGLPKGSPQPMPSALPPTVPPPPAAGPALPKSETPTVGGLPPLSIPQVEVPKPPRF